MKNYYTNTCTFEGIKSPTEPLPENWRKGWKGGEEGQPPLAAACLCLISIKCHRHRWDEQNPGWFDDDEWTRAYHERTLMLKSEVFLFYLKNWHFLKLTDDGVVVWGLKRRRGRTCKNKCYWDETFHILNFSRKQISTKTPLKSSPRSCADPRPRLSPLAWCFCRWQKSGRYKNLIFKW